MKKYNSYKPSGIRSIGNIPEDWDSLKLKYEYKIQKGRIPKIINEKEGDGLVPYLSMEVLRGSDTSSFVSNEDGVFVREGQSLILWDGSNSGEIIKVDKEGILSSTMGVLNKIGNKLDEEFSFYQLKSHEPEIRNNTNGMGIPHVDGQYVRSLVLLTPPLQEQKQIVNYLNKKTNIIDKLISTKQRKVELLKEQRTTLINQVISKGLNPNVKMKDSGVEWIGEIPEHWGITPIRYLGNFQNGISKGSEFFGNGFPFMNYSDVYKNEVTPKKVKGKVESDEVERIRFSVLKGDIFFTRTSESKDDIGISSVCLETIENCCFSGFVIRFRFHNEILLPEYSKYHFQTHWKKVFIESKMNIVTRSSLSQQVLGQLPILIPDILEQQKIVDYLDKHTKEIVDLISLELNKIELLKEYRQSLISEVITGKIKVS